MGKYSVPKEIRDLRPPGTLVKKQGNGYYAYLRSSTRVKVMQEDGTYRWKTQDRMGPCLGTISLENGFIPNGASDTTERNTVLDYGNYACSWMHSLNVLQELELLFSDGMATTIYVAGLIAFNEGLRYLTDLSRKYADSAACMFYPGLSLDSKSMFKAVNQNGRWTHHNLTKPRAELAENLRFPAVKILWQFRVRPPKPAHGRSPAASLRRGKYRDRPSDFPGKCRGFQKRRGKVCTGLPNTRINHMAPKTKGALRRHTT